MTVRTADLALRYFELYRSPAYALTA